MKKIYQQILDFPQRINQKVLNAKLNTEVEGFDSQNGIRHYTKTIYQLISLVIFITLEVAIILSVMSYFKDPSVTFVGKIGGILTALLALYAPFPIAHIIKSRGEGLGGPHHGMVGFVFKDFAITNIRIVGETTAVLGTLFAVSSLCSYLFDTQLYSFNSDGNVLGNMQAFSKIPMEAISTLFNTLKLDYLSTQLTAFSNFSMSGTNSFDGDFAWNINDLLVVGGKFINVMVGLAFLYINLTIYNYLYTMISNLIHWLQSPSIPISMKNK